MSRLRDETLLDAISSIDSGLNAEVPHATFLRWLMFRKQPSVTVELGVDYGYSAFTMASCGVGEVIGVDLFASGDHGERKATDVSDVMAAAQQYRLTNLRLVQMDFHSFAACCPPADIIHIDGNHSYDCVRRDYDAFLPRLRPAGVLLMHDTMSCAGPAQVFRESTLPKLQMHNSNGMGVLSTDEELLSEIRFMFREFCVCTPARGRPVRHWVR